MSIQRSVAAMAIALTLAVSRGPTYAATAGLSLEHYAHSVWRVADGFGNGSTLDAFVQAPDGYLLLATERGILRFDGIRTTLWQPLPISGPVMKLLFSRDGTLWVGTLTGLASWKDGRLTRYAELEGDLVETLAEDREGAVWAVGEKRGFDVLCSVHSQHAQCHGADGSLRRLFGLTADRQGNLWAGAVGGLWRWRDGVSQFYPTPSDNQSRLRVLGEAEDGRLLVGAAGGIGWFTDKGLAMIPLPRGMPAVTARQALHDRHGGIWIPTFATGLLHLREGQVEWFAESDGLSRNFVGDALEDREGNVWLLTGLGLDRFRERAAAPVLASRDLPTEMLESMLAAKDGSMWFATRSGLVRWRGDELTTLERPAAAVGLAQDRRGRVWVTTPDGAGYVDHDRFIPVASMPKGAPGAIATDAAGDLWIAHERALLRLRDGGLLEQIPWSRMGQSSRPMSLAADPTDGLWFGHRKSGLVHFAEGQIRVSYAAAEGLAATDLWDLRFDRDGTLWAATGSGLSRLKNGRVATLTSKTGLPCQTDTVLWTVDDTAGSMWMYLDCGLARVARAEIDAMFAALDRDKNTDLRVHSTLFGRADGVRTDGLFKPRGAVAADGRLWFSAGDGVSVIDPRRIPFNPLPPPVYVEQVTADHHRYEAANGLRLPPLIRDLQIEYTGVALGEPERVQFRYKLEGYDREWQTVGTRRQAFYSNLSPGTYRFRVSASNNDGVWNDTGAALDFAIAPAYYQTRLFRASAAIAALALLGALYRLRAGQLTRQLNVRFEERLAERTRLARDLHDTLLQTIQGSKLVADSALRQTENTSRQRMALEQVAQWLDRAVREGRDALHSLRSSDEQLDLVQALRRTAQSQCGALPLAVTVSTRDPIRPVSLRVWDDVYRIGEEAIRNVCAHASATSLEVEMRFGVDLILSVKDNGTGIDDEAANRGREGHFGVRGMRERATQIGGSLTIHGSDTGTHVTLIVPGHVAFTSVLVGTDAGHQAG